VGQTEGVKATAGILTRRIARFQAAA